MVFLLKMTILRKHLYYKDTKNAITLHCDCNYCENIAKTTALSWGILWHFMALQPNCTIFYLTHY